MKTHRFIGNYDFEQNEVKIVNPENIKQIKGVLRLTIGEEIILSDGKGKSARVRIKNTSQKEIVCDILNIEKSERPAKTVSLYLAILKKENFELAVQKATEVGVGRIVPVITQRTVKTGLNTKRLEKIILEASEQSGRTFLPQLENAMTFSDALKDSERADEKIIFDLVENKYIPNENTSSASIFIGPEGGFTPEEISTAESHGYIPSSLGVLTLRAETAAIIASYRSVNSI